ncbi:MAG TPA: quinol:electron acceptor oxidoreductase subunit ActD, partial [Rhodocyclaceae bacterium]|nr:quinol:electron acceptor oxidoreductase subunit ActD [Rhodocyclaceae bacterium]
MSAPGRKNLYGLLAEFATADALVIAAQAARQAGYQRAEAYAPFHVEGLAEGLGFHHDRVALATFIGGVAGGLGGYLLQ